MLLQNFIPDLVARCSPGCQGVGGLVGWLGVGLWCFVCLFFFKAYFLRSSEAFKEQLYLY